MVVVEHEPSIMVEADHLIDMGPRAGEFGGEVIHAGSYEELLKSKTSVTAAYLRGDESIETPMRRRSLKTEHVIEIVGAAENNLKGIDVTIPVGVFTCVTGVSGSGKSSLVHDILFAHSKRQRGEPVEYLGQCESVRGLDAMAFIAMVDQTPVGSSARATPATYVKAWDGIRKLYSKTKAAKDASRKPGFFSFNSGDGRCQTCMGDGVERIEMQFLSDVTLDCPDCEGKRFGPEALAITWNGLNVAEVLELTISEARDLFRDYHDIYGPLKALVDVGLGI